MGAFGVAYIPTGGSRGHFDSDLELPLRWAREHVPVGLINPSPKQPAGKLRGSPTDCVGGHWWERLSVNAYKSDISQIPLAQLRSSRERVPGAFLLRRRAS